MDLAELRKKLSAHGQEGALRFVGRLSPRRREKLLGQLAGLNLDSISQLVREYVTRKPELALPKNIQPVKVFPRRPTAELKDLYERAEKRGFGLVKDGKVGAFLVAGGQGTRLGFDGPKGAFAIT